MTPHVLDPTITEPLVAPNLRVRHFVEFGIAVAAAAAILVVAVIISGGPGETGAAVPPGNQGNEGFPAALLQLG